MKLRVLRKDVYISASAQKGWKTKGMSRKKDILQMWDDKEGWINIPVVKENVHIYDDSFEIESY